VNDPEVTIMTPCPVERVETVARAVGHLSLPDGWAERDYGKLKERARCCLAALRFQTAEALAATPGGDSPGVPMAPLRLSLHGWKLIQGELARHALDADCFASRDLALAIQSAIRFSRALTAEQEAELDVWAGSTCADLERRYGSAAGNAPAGEPSFPDGYAYLA
jgi:hypothetical protein